MLAQRRRRWANINAALISWELKWYTQVGQHWADIGSMFVERGVLTHATIAFPFSVDPAFLHKPASFLVASQPYQVSG